MDHTTKAFAEQLKGLVSLGPEFRLQWKNELTDSPYSVVSRFSVEGLGEHRSLVVKQYQVLSDDSPSDLSGARIRLYDEYAALKFIEETCSTDGIGPRTIALDREQCLLVQEDLGDGVDQVLYGDDPDTAEAYLLSYVRTLGRLHARTSGEADAFRRLREGLGPVRHELLAGLEVENPDQIEPMLIRWWSTICEAFGGDATVCGADLADVADCVRSPGAYACLTHGDVCNGNELTVDGEIALIDFENAAFRHALLDSAADPSIFQFCYRGDQIPISVQLRMRDAYREALVKGCPDAADDASFYGAISRACIFRSLHQLNRFVRPDIVTQNERAGSTTQWQRILKALDAIVWVTRTYGELSATSDVANQMRAGLRSRWPEAFHTSPLFPAFRNH
jgi:hypothetical protein